MARSQWQRAAYAQRHGNNGTAAKDVLRGLGLLSLMASAAFWGPVQWQLVAPASLGEMFIAASFTAFLVGGPPILTSFLIPWSPGGMLLQRINARTWGSMAVIVCALYLFYYSWLVLLSWWSSRADVLAGDMVAEQAIVGIIAYIITPALLWAPVSSEELAEQLKQAQQVKRYEMQTAADIAILQATLLRAQQLAVVGFANLVAGEREELAGILRGLVAGIDQTQQEIAGNISTAAGVAMQFRSPLDDDEANGLPRLLDYVAGELKQGRMLPVEAEQPVEAALVNATSVPQRVAAHQSPPEPHQSPPAATAAPTMPHDAARCRTMPYGELYAIARAHLAPVWTVKDLAAVLNVEPPTAAQYKVAWERAGLASGAGLPNGRYKLTESEGAE